MNRARLVWATSLGVVAQLLMVGSGHFVPVIRENFMFGGLALSLLAGLIYALRRGGSWAGALGAGALAGGACALIGIAVSCALGDVPPAVMLFGTIGSAVTGAIGGAAGRALPPPRT
jgi:hypothetical protein